MVMYSILYTLSNYTFESYGIA